MGYILFTQNGTFNPSDHGLVVGDVINVVCVGGGASGSSYFYVNSSTYNRGCVAGGASSFGSYCTASGATGTSSYEQQAAAPAGGRAGALCNLVIDSSTNHSYLLAGCGAPGWLPDVAFIPAPMPVYEGAKVYYITPMASTLYMAREAVTKPAACTRGPACSGASTGTRNANNFYSGVSAGSIGYGAGGCAVLFSSCVGGNSGGVTKKTVKLTSTSAIAVTVGKGGTSSGSGSPQYGYAWAGDGADGCVAVFW